MATKSTALAAREADVTNIEGALEKWTATEMALIARTVAHGASGEELRLFLAQAAHLNLNPLNGEIWCVKTRGEDGGEGRIAIIVGEQGRLKVANRSEDYRGYRSDVVRKEDRFLKLSDPKELPGVKGQFTYVEHSYGHPDQRGEVVGAWCEVYREGRPSTFFYAPLEDYMPKNASDKAKKFIPWFKTLDRQIVKCAISTAFRMGFPLLAGVYGEEEINHLEGSGVAQEPMSESIAWGNTEEVAERMRSLFNAANNTVPGSFSDAKILLLLDGLTDEERYSLAADLVIPFIEEHGGSVPEPGEIVTLDSDVEVIEPEDGEPLMRDSAADEHVAADAEAEAGVESEGQTTID